jgi:hypothetical protein
MPKHVVTRYDVDELVRARKIAGRTKLNTLNSSDSKHTESALKVDLRRADSPTLDLTLEFYGRVNRMTLPGVATTQLPSASLIWHRKRIRGIDFKIRHDVVRNGLVTDSIRGWHEHYWTDSDEDNAIREPNPPLRNWDLQAVIAWCSRQWNIEGIGETVRLFNE